MCMGIPMLVVDATEGSAVCKRGDENVTVDMSLVGDQPTGTWVLTFLGAAREVISAEQAQDIQNALEAVSLAVTGANDGDIDLLFADLVGREPQLPPHLRPKSD
ncbi:MAG: hydrogenase expression/formation protein HupF [Rhodomicrobium sp.]|nr:MAG: hydrogenase expression/formation protein HupF [Rhodomicrobium sp.]